MKSSTLAPRSRQPLAAIRPGLSERAAAETRFGTLLVWYMRVLSLCWIGLGLQNWARMLMTADEGPGAFHAVSDLGMGSIIAFAVLDLIAGVGLWLAAAWGGVVWLVAVAAQWLSLVVLPGFFPYDGPLAAVDAVLVAVYFVLTLKAAGEFDQ